MNGDMGNSEEMQFDQELRYIDTGLIVHNPWDIETLGFGKNSVLGVYEGQYVTIERIRAFQLTCGHMVTSHEDIGGHCQECFEQAQEEELPFAEWLSLKCKDCFRRCAVGLCGKGLCPEHRAGSEVNEKHDAERWKQWYCSDISYSANLNP